MEQESNKQEDREPDKAPPRKDAAVAVTAVAATSGVMADATKKGNN